MNRFFVFCFLVLVSMQSFASAPDTVRKIYASNSVKWLRLSDLHSDTLSLHSLDTTANGFQNFNPVYSGENDNARIYLGNLGLATRSLIFEENDTWGFNLGRDSHNPYLKQIDDLKFYKTLSPYTNLYYIWNRKKEQYFMLSFAQNIGPRFNYAVNFSRMVSTGDYNRQASDHLNYDVSMWYSSKNGRYRALAGLIKSSLVLEENGGIKNDSIFTVSSDINSEFEPVFLNNASTRITDKQYYLRQSFAFGSLEEYKIDTFSYSRIKAKSRLFHELKFSNRTDEYKETPLDSGVYTHMYFDSVNTNDKLQAKQLQQNIGIEQYLFSKRSSRKNYATYFLRFDFVDYTNMNFDSTLGSMSFTSNGKYQLAKDLEFKYQFINGLLGSYNDNRLINLQLRLYQNNDSSYFSVELQHRNNDPALSATKFSSNHYRWENQFSNTINNAIKISYLNEKWKFKSSVSLGNNNDQVYYDSLMIPRQLANYKFYQVQIQKAFQVGKFHLLNQMYFQGSDNAAIIRLPNLFTYQSLYFQSYVFKKALNIRTGFDVRYYTKTQAYNYDAASTQFYLSNTSIGDYPLIDFFLTASLKRAVLMLKIDHLNQGIIKKGYYMVNGYPLADRALKIGLRWAFYD